MRSRPLVAGHRSFCCSSWEIFMPVPFVFNLPGNSICPPRDARPDSIAETERPARICPIHVRAIAEIWTAIRVCPKSINPACRHRYGSDMTSSAASCNSITASGRRLPDPKTECTGIQAGSKLPACAGRPRNGLAGCRLCAYNTRHSDDADKRQQNEFRLASRTSPPLGPKAGPVSR